MGPGHALDQAVQAKASEVVGHSAARIGGEIAADEACDVWAEVAVAEAGREMSEAAERLEEGEDARVAKAQGWDPPAVLLTRSPTPL